MKLGTFLLAIGCIAFGAGIGIISNTSNNAAYGFIGFGIALQVYSIIKINKYEMEELKK